jgi:hypothetical protein
VLTTFEKNPLPDGTQKVPCPRRCVTMFSNYSAAVAHAKSCRKGHRQQWRCQSPPSDMFPLVYPWINCSWKFDGMEAYHSHTNSHVRETNVLYLCQFCEDHYMDLYRLAYYELKCTGEETRNRHFDGVYRVTLKDSGVGEGIFVEPSLLIVARSSSHAPKSCFCGREFLSGGIKIFANRVFGVLESDMCTP